jgi:hypothetical protein
MHNRIVLKRILKLTLKQLLHVSVQSTSSGSALFELAEVTVVKIIPKSARHIHQKGRNNICSHTTELKTPMYDYFNNYNFSKLK